MAKSVLESLLSEVERRAVIMVIRAHSWWTLEELFEYLAARGSHAEVLGSVSVHELMTEVTIEGIGLPGDGGPVIHVGRLEQAKRTRGEDFDMLVREAIAEAPRPIGAAYLRARVGGPRWKLQDALQRLLEAGEIERSGVTSSTVYKLSAAS